LPYWSGYLSEDALQLKEYDGYGAILNRPGYRGGSNSSPGKGDRSIFAPHKPVALGASDRVSAAGTAVTVNNRETPRRRSWCDAKIDLSPFCGLWAAVESIAPKIGCVPQTLLEWVKRAEVDAGSRPGVTTDELQRIKDLERENKELRRANEILRTVSAFFAQAELDRKLKS
jgi:transposase